MTQENQSEIWQVEVGGQIYEAPLGELPGWIDEGSLQPEDKIRKGNLRWIEARKVPTLVPFFNAKEKGEPLPLVQTYTRAESIEPGLDENNTPSPELRPIDPIPSTPRTQQVPFQSNSIPQDSRPLSVETCSIHREATAFYICGSCSNKFCKACPSSYGGNVKICPNCGAMCVPVSQAAEAKQRSVVAAGYAHEGFGVSDFFRALGYPFRFKPSLIFGALMFMFFTLGQAASAIGGFIFIGASIVCVMLANMMTFGILANTVENFTQGRLESDFMPSFDNFSIWDDVIHPFLLSIGVYLSSFAPLILTTIVGVYLIFSAASDQVKKFDSEMARVPGTEFYKPDRTMEQSQQVKDLLEKVKQHNQRRIEQQTRAANGDETAITEDDPAEFQKMLDETRAAQIESVAGKNSTAQEQQYAQMLSGILRLAAPLVVIGAIALLWGLFYFPAACAVAGYSRSFMATINPMVGLDTIKRLGFDYVKILLMGFCILIASGVIGGFLSVLFSPLDLPKMGNLPAKAIGSLFTFYFSVVFSCVLGFALFKAADRLKLYR